MVTKQHVMDLVNHRVTHILLVAEASLHPVSIKRFAGWSWMRLGGMGWWGSWSGLAGQWSERNGKDRAGIHDARKAVAHEWSMTLNTFI